MQCSLNGPETTKYHTTSRINRNTAFPDFLDTQNKFLGYTEYQREKNGQIGIDIVVNLLGIQPGDYILAEFSFQQPGNVRHTFEHTFDMRRNTFVYRRALTVPSIRSKNGKRSVQYSPHKFLRCTEDDEPEDGENAFYWKPKLPIAFDMSKEAPTPVDLNEDFLKNIQTDSLRSVLFAPSTHPLLTTKKDVPTKKLYDDLFQLSHIMIYHQSRGPPVFKNFKTKNGMFWTTSLHRKTYSGVEYICVVKVLSEASPVLKELFNSHILQLCWSTSMYNKRCKIDDYEFYEMMSVAQRFKVKGMSEQIIRDYVRLPNISEYEAYDFAMFFRLDTMIVTLSSEIQNFKISFFPDPLLQSES
ncbi:unnamed protein product [Caenorhabditis nigoni]